MITVGKLVVLLLCVVVSVVGIAAPPPDARDSADVTYVILDQRTSLVDTFLCDDLIRQLEEQGVSREHILRTSEFADNGGLWALLPLFTVISELGDDKLTSWYVFVNPETRVDHGMLSWAVLAGKEAAEAHFIAHVLKDTERSITHHYALGVQFPFLPAGFVVSAGLLEATAG